MLELLVIGAVIGLLPAAIAHRKGRSFLGWWIFGALLWIVAVPAALIIKDERRRSCPFCAESISREALVCPHCQRDVPEQPLPERPSKRPLGFKN